MDSWLVADKKGLEKIARRRGLTYVLAELLQNVWDTAAKEAGVTFEPVEGRPLCDLTVTDDDPDGFVDLSHAWTLFAESAKKGNPEKRGRFNFGEKLVLAVCESAEIVSTTGSVHFDDGGRRVGRRRTEKGSVFRGRLRMTREELETVLADALRLIPPENVRTTINGVVLAPRKPLKSFECTLPTEIAVADGYLATRQRATRVDIHEALDRTPNGWLYEMGIPVCPTGDQWDINVAQKIPVNLERRSVSAGYLRSVRVFVLNEMFADLKPGDAASPAVQDALGDERVKPEAVQAVLTQQYGDKRAVFDPSDPEANRRLVADGYTVIPGGALSKDAWANVRRAGAALPSGQIRPTPKPYSNDPNAAMADFIPESKWTAAMRSMAEFSCEYGWKLTGHAIRVRFEKGRMTAEWAANYGQGDLTFNYDRLGASWFECGPREAVLSLLIHEFAHEFEGNHLSTDFYHAIQKLGAKSTELALRDPDFFLRLGYRTGR